jgi:hypothetical protein
VRVLISGVKLQERTVLRDGKGAFVNEVRTLWSKSLNMVTSKVQRCPSHDDVFNVISMGQNQLNVSFAQRVFLQVSFYIKKGI